MKLNIINILIDVFFCLSVRAFPAFGFSHQVRYASSAQTAMTNILDGRLNEIREAGTWKDERVITTEQASEIGVAGRKEKLLNFCANNYLGLSVCVN